MKIYYALILIGTLAITACQSNQEKENHATHEHQNTNTEESVPKKVLSPRKQAMANIGDVHVHIDYSSPGKRGRTIWNGLVAHGQVWVTGAHQATSINFSNDVIIQGQTIPKGKYGFFTIPDSEKWILILNENYEQHLTDDYDEKLDVVRVNVIPRTLSESVESLTYKVISDDDNNGFISVSWDTLEVRLPIAIK